MFSVKALIGVKLISQFLKVIGFLLLVFGCQSFWRFFSKLFLLFLLPLYWK